MTQIPRKELVKALKNAKKELAELDQLCNNDTDDYVFSLDNRIRLNDVIFFCTEQLNYYKMLQNAKKQLVELDQICNNDTDDYMFSLDNRIRLNNTILTYTEKLNYYI